MNIQVFADESGGKGNTRHFLMAALMAPVEAWARFSNEWRLCLDTHPRVLNFKMKDAAGCTGQFYRFSTQQRDDKLRELARVINRHAEAVTYCCIDLDAHADTWGKKLPKPHNEEYFWPYQNIIMGSCFELWDAGLRKPFEIIFDQQVIFGPRARAWYPVAQEVVRLREPEAAKILPADPTFRDDNHCLPLQAADLFAWCLRDGSDLNGQSQFDWLCEELRSVSLSEYSSYYDRDRMNSVLALSEEFERNASVPHQIANAHRVVLSNYKKKRN